MLDPLSHLTDRPLRGLFGAVHEGFQTLFQLMFLSLLLLGLGGLVFKAVRPGGWLEGLLGGAWAINPGYAMLVAVALFIGGAWVKRAAERQSIFRQRGEWLLYSGLALGAYFAIRLIATGTI